MVALQTTEAVVPGSNPSSLIVEILKTGRVIVHTVEISGYREGNLLPEAQEKERKFYFIKS